MFRVPWVDDNGQVQVNRGFRVQFNSAIGPYKGGLRFHPSVNLGIIKFLGFEQVFKNSLTGLPIGGGKGGSDFDPKGKSDREVMALLPELHDRAVAATSARTPTCPPATSAWAPVRSATCSASTSALTDRYEGVLTGKGLTYGGSLARTQATGYGLCLLRGRDAEVPQGRVLRGQDRRGLRLRQRGHLRHREGAAAGRQGRDHERLQRLGVRSRTASTSICVKEIKEVRARPHQRIRRTRRRPRNITRARASGRSSATSPCPAPPRTSCNVEDAEAAGRRTACKMRGRGRQHAHHPRSHRATSRRTASSSCPGKAANAGGVATSALEMSQNSDAAELDLRGSGREAPRHHGATSTSNADDAAKEYGHEGNYVMGANIAGFMKVADAMMAQGIV